MYIKIKIYLNITRIFQIDIRTFLQGVSKIKMCIPYRPILAQTKAYHLMNFLGKVHIKL